MRDVARRPIRLIPWLIVAVVAASALLNGTVTQAPSTAFAAGEYNWLQFDFNSQHSGNNTRESTITASNVASLSQLFQVTLPAIADGAPAYLSGVSTKNGVQDVLFVTTKDGHIVALDAHTGSTIWSQQNGPGTCTINNGRNVCYTTSSPAVDPNLQFVYSYGLDGRVHRYHVGTGIEVTSTAWPEVVTLKDFDEKGSAALSTAKANGTRYLYVVTSGYPGDKGDYQGHLVAIDLSTGVQAVFNTLCSNQAVHFVEQPGTPDCSEVQSGVWARPGTIYDPATNRIYLVTGNATYDPTNDDWGDTVMAVNPDGTGSVGKPLDSYTPANFQQLQNGDLDLGSTAPAILAVPRTSKVKHLAVQGGKDSVLRLLNLDNLSRQGGPGHTGGEVSTINFPPGGEILTQPATWTNTTDGSSWVFVSNDNGIAGLEVSVGSNGLPSLQSIWQTANGGSSPIVANNVLYYAGGGVLRAMSPTSGVTLWQANVGGIHWESPIVANGVLYATDESSHLTAFGLATSPTPTSTPTPTP